MISADHCLRSDRSSNEAVLRELAAGKERISHCVRNLQLVALDVAPTLRLARCLGLVIDFVGAAGGI